MARRSTEIEKRVFLCHNDSASFDRYINYFEKSWNELKNKILSGNSWGFYLHL